MIWKSPIPTDHAFPNENTPKPFSEAAASFCCVPQVFGGEPSLQPPLVPLPVKPGLLATTYSTDIFTTASSKGKQGGCSWSARTDSCSAGFAQEGIFKQGVRFTLVCNTWFSSTSSAKPRGGMFN